MKMSFAFLIWFITFGYCLVFSPADSCTHYAAIGEPYELPLSLTKDHRLRWSHNNIIKYDSKPNRAKNTLSVSEKGGILFLKVTLNDGGSYKAEIMNSNGGFVRSETMVLCTQERVPKPTVSFICDNKGNKVQFTCSGPVTKDITYQWFEDKKPIASEETAILIQTYKQSVSNSFTCSVSNRVSSETSNPVQQNCVKPNTEDDKWLGLERWIMYAILAGGGGLVFVLIVATIVCCTINSRKKRLRIKDEQEMRLHWSTNIPQNHHYSNERGHPHDPAHSRNQSTGQTQGPAAAGHTGPRPPRSRQNRPRPPDPITGQPLPGPRRQMQTGNTQEPNIDNDEENPPPLPQPRKKAPRSEIL